MILKIKTKIFEGKVNVNFKYVVIHTIHDVYLKFTEFSYRIFHKFKKKFISMIIYTNFKYFKDCTYLSKIKLNLSVCINYEIIPCCIL